MTHKKTSSWEERYRGQSVEAMPWYYPHLDPDFKKTLASLNAKGGTALDLGTGSGTQSFELAKMGFSVTATDISPSAINQAKAKAEADGLDIDFKQDDIIQTLLEGQFDYIFDRGLFHVLETDKRTTYTKVITKLLAPGGYLLLKCFSYKEPGKTGPHRLSPDDIRITFDSRLKIISIVDTVFLGQRKPRPKALFCLLASL